MAATISLCRCGKPLIENGRGATFCEHCDRVCEVGISGGCIDCRIFEKASKEHAARTMP